MPDPATLARLRAEAPEGPVVLLNLLAYRKGADGEPAGREAFGRYGAITGPLIAAAGGRVIFAGAAGPVLTGSDTDWDDVLIVRFPDMERFVDMIESDTYVQQAAPIRAEALEATLWMSMNPFPGFAEE
jgi:uncharacterized protein (DUF1330 family)